jgi:hypothetical protein
MRGEEVVMATVAAKRNMANWFEIPVRDLDRATRFYEKVFDVKLTPEVMGEMNMAMFPFDQSTTGAAGSLMKAETYEPSHAGTVVYFSVDDIDATLRRITANGGKVLMPKTPIGQYGVIAQYEDTEGNRLALHSLK